MVIDNKELTKITGGGSNISKGKWGVISVVVGGIITIIVGIIDGYNRPLSCNK